jgi:hypothetical protein
MYNNWSEYGNVANLSGSLKKSSQENMGRIG